MVKLQYDASKLLKLSSQFKDRCEAAAVSSQLSLSAWIRRAMQKQLDRQHDGHGSHKE